MNKIILLLLLIFSVSLVFSQKKTELDFTLETLDGEKVTLSEYLKKGPVYINFWAMWCIPCRSELKQLQPIYEAYKDSGFTILSINIDSPKSLTKVQSYVSSQNYTIPIFIDPNSRILEKLNGKYLPYSVLINQEGKIVKIRTGFLPGDEKEIEKDILELLRGKN
jgi:thiol-disulfide isomerase/thioredoxin